MDGLAIYLARFRCQYQYSDLKTCSLRPEHKFCRSPRAHVKSYKLKEKFISFSNETTNLWLAIFWRWHIKCQRTTTELPSRLELSYRSMQCIRVGLFHFHMTVSVEITIHGPQLQKITCHSECKVLTNHSCIWSDFPIHVLFSGLFTDHAKSLPDPDIPSSQKTLFTTQCRNILTQTVLRAVLHLGQWKVMNVMFL